MLRWPEAGGDVAARELGAARARHVRLPPQMAKWALRPIVFTILGVNGPYSAMAKLLDFFSVGERQPPFTNTSSGADAEGGKRRERCRGGMAAAAAEGAAAPVAAAMRTVLADRKSVV